MARVPLEQQSTTRLLAGFLGTIVLPVAAACAVVAYCVLQFTSAFVDLVGHFPIL